MRHSRIILIVFLVCVFVSFVEKGNFKVGLSEGDIAPNFTIKNDSVKSSSTFQLDQLRGQYVLLSFWATYDAASRINNLKLDKSIHALTSAPAVTMVSISFDTYASVFKGTLKRDNIQAQSYVVTQGSDSDLYKKYQLHKGFYSLLIDANGVIVAKNVKAEQLEGLLQ